MFDTAKVESQKIVASLDATISSIIVHLHSDSLSRKSNSHKTHLHNKIQSAERKTLSWSHPEKSVVDNGTMLTEIQLEKYSREQKVVIIHNASVQKGILPTMMAEPCCTFFKDIAIPIVKCLEQHFQNN